MTEIGKVSVRVMPDTRGFATKAKRDLKRLKDLSFKVDVELNERQFNAQVKRLIAKTNAELLNPENRIKFRASLEASDRQLSSEVRDVRRRMQAMADEEKIEFKAELDKKLGKRGKGGLLHLDPKGAVRELKRELGGTRYELPVYANLSGVQKDLRRMARSEKLKVDVDLLVDRKEVYKDFDSMTKVLRTASDALLRTKGLKLQVDVDKASVRKWIASVNEAKAAVDAQRKSYKDIQRELKIATDRSADYAKKVSESTKAVTKLKAQQKADAKREADLTNELLEVRRVIAASAGDVTEEAIREKRLVGQIEKMRREAFERSAKRAEAEAKAVQEIRDASREIQKLEEKRAKLKAQGIASAGKLEKLEIDHRKMQKDLDRARNKLKMSAIELDVNLDQASTEAVAARLAILARDRVVTIFTRIQKTSLGKLEQRLGILSNQSKELGNNIVKWIGQLAGVRVLWRSFRDMVDWLPRLDMMVPQLAQNFALLTSAVTASVGALGAAFTLLSDIGEVGKLALIAPAGIAALGVFGTILNAAFNKNYIKDYAPDLVASFKEMQEILGSSFWKGAKKGLIPFFEDLIGLGKTLGKTTASDLGKFFGAFGKGSQSILKKEGPRFFKNLSKFMENASGGAFALGHALTRLTGVASDSFGAFGTWFTDVMEDFDSWVERNSKNGNITRWITEGATALRELGSIGVSTIKIVAGIADAFNQAGWPGLTELATGMRWLGEAALNLKDSDAFMQPLEQIRYFFEQFKGLDLKFEITMKNLWGLVGSSAETLARPIANALAYIMDGFNSPKFQSGFGTFIDGVATFIQDIGPGIGATVEEFGSLLEVVGTAAGSWGPAFNDMLLLFSSAGDKLHPGVIDFVENLGPRLQDLVTDITPHVEDFAEALSNLLGDEDFQDLVGDLIGDLGDLGGIILDLGTWVVDTAGKFSDWYGGLSDGQQSVVRWAAIVGGALGGLALAVGRLAFAIAPVGSLKLIGKAFSKVFITGGLAKILRPILGRFIGVLTGPVGWALLIASLIKPLAIADFAKWVLEALGLDDSWAGRFVDSLSESISMYIGDGNLIDWVLAPFKDAWGHFSEGDWVAGILDILSLGALRQGGMLAAAIADALGYEDLAEDLRNMDVTATISNALSGLGDWVVDGILAGWEWIKGKVDAWVPDSVIEFFKHPWKTIKGWLFGGDGSDMSAAVDPMAVKADIDYSKPLKDYIPAGLQEAWDKLIGFFMEWNPVSVGFKLGTWIGDKIKELLGIGEGGAPDMSGFSVSFDFSSLWESKIKPALTIGLLGLVALITAPALLLVAPLALPALIIGWLLGRDGDGDWSFSELQRKIEGAWGAIKGAITAGVGTIIGLVGGIVMTPIAIGTKIVDWILGSDWVQKAKDGLTTAIRNAGPALKEGIDTGVTTVKTGIGVGTGAGGTVMQRILGTNEEGKGRIKLDFGAIGGWVKQFGGTTRDEYSATASGTGRSMDLMSGGTKRGFEEIRANALRKSMEMRSGVGRDFSTMQSQATAKAAKMQADVTSKMGTMQAQAAAKAAKMQIDVVRAMTQANVQGVRQASLLGSAYVVQLRAMAANAARVTQAMRASLLRILTIPAAGPGRSTGSSFVSGLSSGLSRAVGVARGMASHIRGALSFSVYSSGVSVGSTFASGVRSKIGAVSAAASALAAAARKKFPNSPAEEGPFSGRGWGGWGESIADELAKGLRKSAPEVAREAERLMGGVHSALDARSDATIGVDFERTRRRYGLSSDEEPGSLGTTEINVNVESRSEDPLRDGNRFGGDIAFALRGAGLA